MATMTMISNVMRMTLRARFFPINSCRGISSAANNFVVGAGFSSETANSNYGTRPLFLLDQGKTLSYMDVNRRSGYVYRLPGIMREKIE
jgi:hypothetical protein